MLTGIRLAIAGGDARYRSVIRQLLDLDASLTLIGFETLELPSGSWTKENLQPQILQHMDGILLPITGIDDDGRLAADYATNSIFLQDIHFRALSKSCKVFTGIATQYLKQTCAKYQLQLVELLERDDVAIYNSIPTAEGALMLAIQHTPFTIHGSRSMVLGLGRVGITIARMLKAIGSHVCTGVKRNSSFARAYEEGFAPFYTSELQAHVSNIDLLFNTIPSMIVTAQIIARLPDHALIVDLASRPGGTDFRFAEKRGIHAILAPGLPGLVAPQTAGRIIADTISQILLDDGIARGITE